jgi:putative ATP-binding cassette transporter
MHLLPDLKARNKTVFVITHDDRYYHVAERIIKMDNGQVVSDLTQEPRVLEMAVGNTSDGREGLRKQTAQPSL